MSRHANVITVDEKARRVFEIQAHVFRFNGTLAKGAEVRSTESIEQKRCQLFRGPLSGVGVVY